MNAPLPPTSLPPDNNHGTVHVFRRVGDIWSWNRIVKSTSPGHADSFGRAITLSGNGLTMAVSATGEDSAARGIDGNQQDNSRESAGAVYLY